MKKLLILFLCIFNYSFVQANEQINDNLYTAKEVINNYKFYEGTTGNQYFPFRSVIKNNLGENTSTNNYYGIYQDFKNNNVNTGTLDYLKIIINNITN